TGGPATYNVAVSGLSGDGTVTASLAIRLAHALRGHPSEPGTSTDDTVAFNASSPTGASITPSDMLVSDADVGAGTVTVEVMYDEAMDSGVDPTITFSPSLAGTLAFASGTWSAGDTTYTAAFDVADGGVEI